MRRAAVALFAFICAQALAQASVSATDDVGAGVGKLRFDLVKLGSGPYERYASVDAAIRIHRLPSGELLQTIQAAVGIPSPEINISDLNGDGFKDLIFYNDCAGYAGCAGPSIGGDVYLYIPKLQQFVKSETLSGRGEVRSTAKKGCVTINFKSGPAGYTDETWCFNQSAGRWRLVGSSGGEPTRD